MYLEGKGVDKDEDMAAIWYRKAIEQGHADAHARSLARIGI
jgi:TPR repeat protein